MLKKSIDTSSNIRNIDYLEGETIEIKIARILANNEPITDGAPLIYNEREDGVNADTNIRTDRWEVALQANDIVTKSKLAQRMGDVEAGRVKKEDGEGGEGGENTATEPIGSQD